MPEISFDTPTGAFCLTQQGDAIVKAGWHEVQAVEKTNLLEEAQAQVLAYFAGELEVFDLPLKVNGSDFQRKVCAAMIEIPYGKTMEYGEIAKDVGASAQAVGGACGGNPIPLIIPCHRVLAANGLGGFSGTYGVETKVALLKHEGAAGLLI